MRYHLKEERYIFPLIIILWLCNKYIINYYAISCKILMCTLDQNYLFHVYSNGKTFYNFLINTAWPPKQCLRFFSVMFQSLLKPHYVYTAWLHKISPTLIVCRICSINSIRNLRHVLQIIDLRTTYTKTKPLGVPMQELISFKVNILCQ
jgi:hypothetical protein